jgi:hypothetical protein
MDPKLFNNILLRIHRILKYNYLESFYQEKKIELLSIPTVNYKMHLPKLEFSSTGSNLPANKGNKNCNIFELMLMKRGFQEKVGTYQLDQNFQSQLRNFIGTISSDSSFRILSSQSGVNNGGGGESSGNNQSNHISGVSKINNNSAAAVTGSMF